MRALTECSAVHRIFDDMQADASSGSDPSSSAAALLDLAEAVATLCITDTNSVTLALAGQLGESSALMRCAQKCAAATACTTSSAMQLLRQLLDVPCLRALREKK